MMLLLPRAATLLLGAAAVLVLGAGQSRADFVVKLETGSYSESISWDHAAYDDSGDKEISWVGSFHGFAINFVIATSNSPGSPDGAFLTIDSMTVDNPTSRAGTLVISVTDTDFALPGSNGSLMDMDSSAGGSISKKGASLAGNSFTFQSYADLGNQEFGKTITSGPQTFNATGNSTYSIGGAPNGDKSVDFTHGPEPYSLTDVSTITLNPGVKIQFSGNTDVSDPLPAPEPATLALLLTGLPCLGLGGWLRRRGRPA
jgi:hypothetical protein